MKLLLDTHIWIWSLLARERLTREVARALADPGNDLWLSPISVWETLMLADKRRLTLQPNAEKWITKAFENSPIREAALTHEVALESGRLRFAHNDPADRFLGATAVVYGLTLVTADERLLSMSELATLANR